MERRVKPLFIFFIFVFSFVFSFSVWAAEAEAASKFQNFLNKAKGLIPGQEKKAEEAPEPVVTEEVSEEAAGLPVPGNLLLLRPMMPWPLTIIPQDWRFNQARYSICHIQIGYRL